MRKSYLTSSPGHPRARWLWSWSLVSLVAVAAAYFAGQAMPSPWADAAQNSQKHVVVTAEVEEREFGLSQDTFRGQVSLGAKTTVGAPESGEGRAVVTNVYHKVGSTVRSGDLLAQVSGKPVLLLELPFPLYRDILGGDSGEDVSALQEELRSLGYYRGVVDGKYGVGTAQAVEQLYAAHGLIPPPPNEETATQLQTAQESLADAKSRLSSLASQGEANTEEARSTKSEVSSLAREVTRLALQNVTPVRYTHIAQVKDSPVTVSSAASVGTDLAASEVGLVVLQVGEPTVTFRVGMSSLKSFQVDSSVVVSSLTDPTQNWEGTVTRIGEFTTQNATGTEGAGHDVTVSLGGVEGLSSDLEVVVAGGSLAAEVGMSVPLTAVRQSGTQNYVVRQTAESSVATTEVVEVTLQGTESGFAFITSDELKVGELVVIGS